MDIVLKTEIVHNVCKVGQGAECCRYLACSVSGFECLKNTDLKKTIDQKIETNMAEMVATAINCEGTGRWLYTISDDDNWSDSDECSTKVEAIMKGRKEAICEEVDTYYVGLMEMYKPKINLDILIEQIVDDAYDECGECSEDFLSDVKNSALIWLEDALNKVLSDWLKKYNLTPDFGKVSQVAEYQVKDQMEDQMKGVDIS